MQECIDHYGPLIWSLARRFSPNAADAEDAVQEVFVALWQHAQRYDPEKGAEATFVSILARRRLIDRDRSRQRETRRIETLKTRSVQASAAPARDIEIAEEAQLARDTLRQLSPDQQRVLELAIHGGHTHEEIARITELPLGTVKTHARRGLIRVRQALREQTGQAEASS
jgi:RNA polymerase sigma-70 factor (ECF subfamily)